MRVLVTGASGFVGQTLCMHLAERQHHVVAQARAAQSLAFAQQHPEYLAPQVGQLNQIAQQASLFEEIDTIVHCAARVHQIDDSASNPLAAYRSVNTAATLEIARVAAQAKIKRFIFISSVKVNGEFTMPGQSFRADDAIRTQDPYALSKWEAEQGLREIAAKTGMEVVIIRPPLVYGPGVKANFLTMLRWLQRGIPLPLGAIRNQRSLLALPNLVDFITVCLTHPQAANQTFLISDQHDLSTTELVRDLGEALGRPARLIPVPQTLLMASLQALGKSALAQRLCQSLRVDASPATTQLGWKPPVSVQEAFQLTANHLLQQPAAQSPSL